MQKKQNVSQNSGQKQVQQEQQSHHDKKNTSTISRKRKAMELHNVVGDEKDDKKHNGVIEIEGNVCYVFFFFFFSL